MRNVPLQIMPAVHWLRTVCPDGELFSDSREIGPDTGNAVFFAYEGDSADGRNYISNAIENGAVAVIYESEGFSWNPEWKIPHFGISDLKAYAGPIADAYYGSPAKSMLVIAVTGTNGKTSSTQWIGQSLSKSGKKTAVIGTLGISVFENGMDTTESGAWHLTMQDGKYYLIGTPVPEPAAFAAIAGILAIGLAAYRRRR